MSYLVLARKYRPTTFADLVGQDHVVRTLSNAITLGRTHHAFLFTGARGVGKTTTARLLAKALNCEHGPTPEPCGQCVPCAEITRGASPDVLEIDGASNTGVDNVRELRENVKYLPQRGRFKLYIIDEVHMLSQAAFNALLKTLEEPPSHVKFILATTEPHKIPITILSRCQRFDFRRLSMPQLTEHLRGVLKNEGVALSSQAVLAVAREAQGSARDAMSLLDQVLSYAGDTPEDDKVLEALGVVDRQAIFDLFGAVLRRDARALLETVGELDRGGHDLGEVASLLVEHVRDVCVVKTVDQPDAVLLERSPGEMEGLRAQANEATLPTLHRYFSLLVSTAEDLGRSSFTRVSLEMGLLRLLEVEPAERLEHLLTRLDGALTGSVPARSASSAGPSVPAPPTATPLRASASATPAASSPPLSAASVALAPPPSAAPAASAPPPSAAPGDVWPALVARVKSMRPALASVLEHGRPISVSKEEVKVGYPAGFYFDQARDESMCTVMDRALADHFGARVKYTATVVEAGAQVAESEAAKAERKRQEYEASVRRSAVEHPAVRDAVDVLEAQIKEERPLGGPQD